MELKINGEPREVSAATVAELVEHLGLGGQPVAVELNRRVVPKRQHDQTPLAAGDELELVTLVGGG